MLEIVGEDAPPGAGNITEVADRETHEEEEPDVPLKQIIGRIFSEVTGIKFLFVCGLVAGIIAGATFAFWAYLFGEMIIIINQPDVGDRALDILFYFGSMGLVFGLATFLQFN